MTPEDKEASRLTKEEWREYTKTVWAIANTSDPDHPAVFPPEIPKRLVKLFSFVGETVLDPFAGVGTTGRVALDLKRKSVLVEQNPEFANRIDADLVQGRTEVEGRARLVVGDARQIPLPDESVSLVVTSPPYWDKADYGGLDTDLGRRFGYVEFLQEIRGAFAEMARVLEPGRKLCIVTANVNQQTEEGLLTFPLATDFAVILRDLGLLMVNEIIWNKDGTGGKWGSYGAQRPIFGSYPFPPNLLFKNVHEYILIFAKAGSRKRTGPKVRNYRELMTPAVQVEKG